MLISRMRHQSAQPPYLPVHHFRHCHLLVLVLHLRSVLFGWRRNPREAIPHVLQLFGLMEMKTVVDIIVPAVASNRRRRPGIARAILNENIFPEIEFLGLERIAMLSPLHVLVDLRNRDVKVEVQAQDHPGEEEDEHREGGVLEVSRLDLHRSELHPPTDRRADRGRFEPDCLPVRRLYILENASSTLGPISEPQQPHLKVIHTVLVILILQL